MVYPRKCPAYIDSEVGIWVWQGPVFKYDSVCYSFSMYFKDCPIDFLMERCGYLKCQIQLSDLVRARQKDLNKEMTQVHLEIKEAKSLMESMKKIRELARLEGEMDGLTQIWRKLSVLQYEAPSVPRSNSDGPN